MAFVITLRIPTDAFKKCGIDRDKFYERIKKYAKEKMPNVELEITKSKEVL